MDRVVAAAAEGQTSPRKGNLPEQRYSLNATDTATPTTVINVHNLNLKPSKLRPIAPKKSPPKSEPVDLKMTDLSGVQTQKRLNGRLVKVRIPVKVPDPAKLQNQSSMAPQLTVRKVIKDEGRELVKMELASSRGNRETRILPLKIVTLATTGIQEKEEVVSDQDM